MSAIQDAGLRFPPRPGFVMLCRMLSYQHGFHAGNFADCHKHGVLCALLATLLQKDSSLTFYDFFAGRGRYDLRAEQAAKTGEHHDGIARLLTTQDVPAALQPYLSHVTRDAPFYAGSPVLIQRTLRVQDRLVCNDAHPAEFAALEHTLSDRLGLDSRIVLHHRDAWEAMYALLPPRGDDRTPRGLVILDPAYEVKSDYTVLAEAMARALKKFSHGTYLIWYPLLPANLHTKLFDLFRQYITHKTLRSELIVRNGAERGMYGSGLLLVNPPWQFESTINEIGVYLATTLGQDDSATHNCDWLVAEKA